MFNRKLLEEIKSLWTNPNEYANKILKMKNNVEGDILKLDDITKIKTQKGSTAYDEADCWSSKKINFI